MAEGGGLGTPRERMLVLLSDFLNERSLDSHYLNAVPSKWEIHGDLALVPFGAFADWREFDDQSFWKLIANALGAERIGIKGEVSGDMRRPSVEMVLGDDGEVVHKEHGISYCYDVTKSMFSAGNLPERGRMGDLDCSGETVLDLYAGIGYYTLPILVRAGAAKVHACEWSGDSLRALERGLAMNGVADRCVIHAGDNQDSIADDGSAAEALSACDRVILGLLPSSERSWTLAMAAIKPEGGRLHLHGNAPGGQEQEWANQVAHQLEMMSGRKVTIENLVKVKWYAPHKRHCVIDLVVGNMV